MEMDDNQIKAINQIEGPCMILAGPGTGKTTTLISKINKLIEIYDEDEILCLTFSREATQNLMNKVDHNITIRTFHGFCLDILKEHGHKMNIDSNFKLIDPDYAKVIMYSKIGDTPYNSDLHVKSVSTAKDYNLTIKDYEDYLINNKPEGDLDKLLFEYRTLHLGPKDMARKKELKIQTELIIKYNQYVDFVQSWKKYEQYKSDHNLLDYADLNVKALELIKKFPIQLPYKYILVDEFQDTNKLQFDFIKHITDGNITIVGDKNQSIYGFRGAYDNNFEHFSNHFNDTVTINLDRSWRSPNTVLRSAHDLILNNFSDNEPVIIKNGNDVEGTKTQIIQLETADEEARHIVDYVEQKINEGVSPGEVCVIHRTHKQAKPIIDELNNRDIQYISAGKVDLIKTKEIKEVISYLAIINNIYENQVIGQNAWFNLFKLNHHLDITDHLKIAELHKKNNYETDETKKQDIGHIFINQLKEIGISDNGQSIINNIIEKVNDITHQKHQTLSNLILTIYDMTGLSRAYTHEKTANNFQCLNNLKKFHSIAIQFEELHGDELNAFIDYIEILIEVGIEINIDKFEYPNSIRLMTVHATKGLEFEHVMLTNLAHNRFPTTRTGKEPLIPAKLHPDIKHKIDWDGNDVDKQIKEYQKQSFLREERRLCYVAMTRTKKQLNITFAKKYNSKSGGPSQFLKEMNYSSSTDMHYIEDTEIKSVQIAKQSAYELHKNKLKHEFIRSLDSDDIKSLLSRLSKYYIFREGRTIDQKYDLNQLINTTEILNDLKKYEQDLVGYKPEHLSLSPSSLNTYLNCPRKYEFSKVYQLPTKKYDATELGSAVHKVCEDGVKEGFTTEQQFMDRAKTVVNDYDAEYDEMVKLLKVFWVRNNEAYTSDSKVEQELKVKKVIDGVNITIRGFADRVDYVKDNKVDIIDYKTGKSKPDKQARELQLGFYALALKQKGYTPRKLIIELLGFDKPLVGTVQDNGEVIMEGRTTNFDLSDVEKMIDDTIQNIINDYQYTFTPDYDKCMFCPYKFYCDSE